MKKSNDDIVTIETYDTIKHTIRSFTVSKKMIKSAKVDEKNPSQLNVIFKNGYEDSYIHINKESAKGFENKLNEK